MSANVKYLENKTIEIRERENLTATAARILNNRPEIRQLFIEILSLPADEQAEAIRLCVEALKPENDILS